MSSEYVRPSDEWVLNLLGGHHFDGVRLTQDQVAALALYYGGIDVEGGVRESRVAFEASEAERKLRWEEDFERNPRTKPLEVRRFDEAGTRALFKAGRNKSLKEAASLDGLRLMAFLAKFLERGEDPVRMVEGLLLDAGFDITDGGWPEDSFEEEEEGR